MAGTFPAALSEPVLEMLLAYIVSIYLYYTGHGVKDFISRGTLAD